MTFELAYILKWWWYHYNGPCMLCLALPTFTIHAVSSEHRRRFYRDTSVHGRICYGKLAVRPSVCYTRACTSSIDMASLIATHIIKRFYFPLFLLLVFSHYTLREILTRFTLGSGSKYTVSKNIRKDYRIGTTPVFTELAAHLLMQVLFRYGSLAKHTTKLLLIPSSIWAVPAWYTSSLEAGVTVDEPTIAKCFCRNSCCRPASRHVSGEFLSSSNTLHRHTGMRDQTISFLERETPAFLTRWLGSVVVRASDLWSRDRQFDSRPVHCRVA